MIYAIGEAVEQLGFGLAWLGLAIVVVALVAILTILVTRRVVHPQLSVLAFRASLVVILGTQIAFLGRILTGALPGHSS